MRPGLIAPRVDWRGGEQGVHAEAPAAGRDHRGRAAGQGHGIELTGRLAAATVRSTPARDGITRSGGGDARGRD